MVLPEQHTFPPSKDDDDDDDDQNMMTIIMLKTCDAVVQVKNNLFSR